MCNGEISHTLHHFPVAIDFQRPAPSRMQRISPPRRRYGERPFLMIDVHPLWFFQVWPFVDPELAVSRKLFPLNHIILPQGHRELFKPPGGL
jgi:hypothetical protein